MTDDDPWININGDLITGTPGKHALLVDAWPPGKLQAQLNRIEQKIDLIGMRLGLVGRGAYREWYGLGKDG